jgi:hypothetical protein
MSGHGVGFVAMTDHAEDVDANRWSALVAGCERVSTSVIRVIPGLEFRFADYPGLHLLAMGLRRWICPASPEEFIEGVRGQGALTVVAHPGLAGYRLPACVQAEINGLEVWNGSFNTRYLPDPRAIALLRQLRRRRPEVVGTVGLDQHDLRNVRELRVVLKSDSADPLGEVRSGRFRNHGRTMAFSSALDWPVVALTGLYAVRAVFDRIEFVHDRLVRYQRRTAAGAP